MPWHRYSVPPEPSMLRSASGIAFRPGAIEATPWHRYSVPPEPSMLRSASGIAFRQWHSVPFQWHSVPFQWHSVPFQWHSVPPPPWRLASGAGFRAMNRPLPFFYPSFTREGGVNKSVFPMKSRTYPQTYAQHRNPSLIRIQQTDLPQPHTSSANSLNRLIAAFS